MEILPGWIGKSRIEAARLAEIARCAQVPENYIKELSEWTAADDHGEAPATRAAVIAALTETARRIRARATPARTGAALHPARDARAPR